MQDEKISPNVIGDFECNQVEKKQGQPRVKMHSYYSSTATVCMNVTVEFKVVEETFVSTGIIRDWNWETAYTVAAFLNQKMMCLTITPTRCGMSLIYNLKSIHGEERYCGRS